MKRIIFYHPQPLVENPQKGSELRPLKMLKAFKNIGYRVDLVTGNSKKRKASINDIKKKIVNGISYDFLYAESVNMPVPFADSHHIPVRPLQDYFFFKMLNKYNVPIGLFYRDVYWRDNSVKNEFAVKHRIKKMMHWLEWFGIRKTVDHLFLPTIGMASYLPNKWPKNSLSALYPGCEIKEASRESTQQLNVDKNVINVFYVGGVKLPYYDLRPMIKLVGEIDEAELVLCCRREEWKEFSYYYNDLDFESVEVVHAGSTKIGNYYNQADIVLDIRSPIGYLQNTMPIKIIEALGYETPVLVLKGTEYAEFVKNEKTGWVVETIEDAKNILHELKADRAKIAQKKNNLKRIRKRHTWEERARQAAGILEELNNG